MSELCASDRREVWTNPFCTRFVRPGSIDFRFRWQHPNARQATSCLVDSTQAADDAEVCGRQLVTELIRCRHGVIVGPHGSGKTTLLHWLDPLLRERFSAVTRVQLHAATARSLVARVRHARRTARLVMNHRAELAAGGLLIVDGAEQLGGGDLTRLLRAVHRGGQSVLATSHAPLARFQILHQTRIDEHLIGLLCESLLRDCPPPLADLVRGELGGRDLSRLTNVRDLWFELYDVVQPHIVAPQRIA